MESDPQFGPTPTMPQATMPPPPMTSPLVSPMMQAPIAQSPITQPPMLPPSALAEGSGGVGAILRVAAVVLVTLLALGVAAGTLPGSVVQARTVAYPQPHIGITTPQNSGPIRVGDSVTFDAQILAGHDLTLTWDFGDGTTGQGAQAQHAYTDYGSDGTYGVTLDAVDPIGQRAETQLTVHVLPAQPVAAFTANINPDNPFEVTFDGTGSQGTQLSCTWDFGDGNTDTSGNCQPVNDYQKLGTYTVTLTVQDIANQTATLTQQVKISLPKPTASFNFSTDGFGCVSVDASASTGYQLTYGWDFGDGSTDSTFSSGDSHCYFSSGTFTITLVVTDSGGQTAKASQSVTV